MIKELLETKLKGWSEILGPSLPVLDGISTTVIIRDIENFRPLRIKVPEEIIRPLSQRLGGKHIPIIAMTAHAMTQDNNMCKTAEMDDYITKPFSLSQLKDALNRLGSELPPESPSAAVPSIFTETENAQLAPMTFGEATRVLATNTNLTPQQIVRVVDIAIKGIEENLKTGRDAYTHKEYHVVTRSIHTLKVYSYS
jgi:CheY-like chemotaxis protein